MYARCERESDRFTVFDGRVPKLEPADDPFSIDGPVMSASRLEQVGTCGLAYFFDHVLRIEPVEDKEPDPKEWLDAAARGSVLHEVFHRFWDGLIGRNEKFSAAGREKEMMAILDERVKVWRDRRPPHDEHVFRREVGELRKTARIFLQAEEEYMAEAGGEPLFLEAAAGLQSGEIPSPIDRCDPVGLDLGNGKKIRACGRIDRIDRLASAGGAPDGSGYAVWDYKTGSKYKYDRGKSEYLQGRVIQPALHLALAGELLREKVSKSAGISFFGYFFPGPRERGERLFFSRKKLARWKEVIAALCEVVSRGCFLPTDNGIKGLDDCLFCDFKTICITVKSDDLDSLHSASAKKLRNDPALSPIREVKEHG